MEDFVQIRIGNHLSGIIGLKAALAESDGEFKGMSDDEIGKALLEKLSKHNYIAPNAAGMYEDAFVREYKKHVGIRVDDATDETLRIKVLGPGCPACEHLEKEIMTVMAESGITGDLTHVRDVAEIGQYGVMGTPALVINEEVRAVGYVPNRAKLRDWLRKVSENK